MFFYASKIVYFVIQPSSLALLALATGLLLLRRGRVIAGRRAVAAATVWLLACGFLPLGNALVLPLEARFGSDPPKIAADADIAGIIMLGGFEDGWVSSGHRELAVNEAAERLTETLRLANRFPRAKVVFTGGVGELLPGADAGGPVRIYLGDVGIAADRIVIESASRNTYENAAFTRALLGQASGHFLLVTSAYHMPRAVGVFRHAGFAVVPYPVDYRTRGTADLLRPFSSMPDGLKRVDLAVKEWIGLFAYRITGRTDALFPKP